MTAALLMTLSGAAAGLAQKIQAAGARLESEALLRVWPPPGAKVRWKQVPRRATFEAWGFVGQKRRLEDGLVFVWVHFVLHPTVQRWPDWEGCFVRVEELELADVSEGSDG